MWKSGMWALSLWWLVGCISSTPPVAKIALVAPFEGLHRQTGYAALEEIRAAIAACHAGKPHLPLALDDSYLPENATRALAKIDADPAVEWIVGPFAPASLAAILPHPLEMHDQDIHDRDIHERIPGINPFLIHPDGRFAVHTDWAVALAHYIRTLARELAREMPAATRLLIAGLPPIALPHLAIDERPDDESQPGLPLLFIPSAAIPETAAQLEAEILAAYAPGDVLLWLHPGPDSVISLARLRRDLPALALIFGPDAGHSRLMPHFSVPDTLPATTQPDTAQAAVYWAVWQETAYTDTRLAFGSEPDALRRAEAELIRLAVCEALGHSQASLQPGADNQPLLPDRWRLYLLPLNLPDYSE